MRFYITNGNQYISSKSGIHAVSNIKDAGQYELDKAQNVLKAIPKTLRIYPWKLEEICDESEKCKISLKEVDNAIQEYTGLTDNILEKMINVEEYVSNLKKYLIVIDRELEKIRLEIIDIEHAAEFFDLDLYKGWKLYKLLQDTRKKRRKYKDEKAKIEYILNSNFVDCTNSKISEYIKGFDDRSYKPRVLQELFN